MHCSERRLLSERRDKLFGIKTVFHMMAAHDKVGTPMPIACSSSANDSKTTH
jgi:hypothetical protein